MGKNDYDEVTYGTIERLFHQCLKENGIPEYSITAEMVHDDFMNASIEYVRNFSTDLEFLYRSYCKEAKHIFEEVMSEYF